LRDRSRPGLGFSPAASPAARKRFARSLIAAPATCGIFAAGVPGRGEYLNE
jgi:hypothetical protein